MAIEHVAIVGGGFSGTLQAINLLRHQGPRATLIDRQPQIGRGIAYSAAHRRHLLNVRAANMSAYPDDPGHFVRWLQQNHGGDGERFVPRQVYGDYLVDQLQTAIASTGSRLRTVRSTAANVELTGSGVRIATDDGQDIDADALVVALGNLPPTVPAGINPEALGPDLYVGDPWSNDWVERLDDTRHVLLLGSGLTMVDAVLLLDAHGFRGKITAISRRGLRPRAHDICRPVPLLNERPTTIVSELLAEVRRDARALGWREAIDRLRPFTQNLWLAATSDERARFLRHLRPWWDVHRHRLAPQVAERLVAMQASGQLAISAGRTVAFDPLPDGIQVCWRPRGEDMTNTLKVQKIVNCTGPQGDLLATREPLLLSLLAAGLVRPDSDRLGLDVNAQTQLIGSDGKASDRLFALGPMTRGAFWEITAVPDIRQQTWALARRLANAHWVEGEGL